MESVGEEILREILVKLHTRDLARSSCVSRLWRIIVGDPSFRSLHGKAAHVVSAGAVETLLIGEIGDDDDRGLEMVVLNASWAKPLCRVTDLDGEYSPANACNGFILFGSSKEEDPLHVCNPITSEKLKITPPPPASSTMYMHWHAMGFSPSTRQYKLFRFSINLGGDEDETQHINLVDVYTLGDNCGWRRSPYMFPVCGIYLTPPVPVDGKLYVVTQRLHYRGALDRILVIDMASEACCIYRLPNEFTLAVGAEVHTFELHRRLCIALHIAAQKRLCFWVMPSMQGRRLQDDKNDMRLPGWERRYSFDINVDTHDDDDTRCAWFNEHDGMLCYRLGGCLYKYDTAKEKKEKKKKRGQRTNNSFNWDHQIQLPAAPPESQDYQRWNAYGGYRPSLVSPCLAFASTSIPQHRDKQEQYEQGLLHAMRCKKSTKKRPSRCPPHCTGDKPATKRVRELNHMMR